MQITDVLMDPELGRSAFTVERLTYTRSATGTSSRSQTYSALGCVHPGTPEMIQLLPEEERRKVCSGHRPLAEIYGPGDRKRDPGQALRMLRRVSDPCSGRRRKALRDRREFGIAPWRVAAKVRILCYLCRWRAFF